MEATDPAGTHHRDVPAEVKQLEGIYHGEWTMFGIDESGQVVPRSSWKDTVTAKDATLDGNRAYVSCTDELVFDGGHVPPQTYAMVEGYFVNADGSLGDYFMESFGQLTRLHRLENGTWVYSVPATPQELEMLGFTDVISAEHVMVKAVTHEDGHEAHRITRVTTINWSTADGDRWLQFVSMTGRHLKA